MRDGAQRANLSLSASVLARTHHADHDATQNANGSEHGGSLVMHGLAYATDIMLDRLRKKRSVKTIELAPRCADRVVSTDKAPRKTPENPSDDR